MTVEATSTYMLLTPIITSNSFLRRSQMYICLYIPFCDDRDSMTRGECVNSTVTVIMSTCLSVTLALLITFDFNEIIQALLL